MVSKTKEVNYLQIAYLCSLYIQYFASGVARGVDLPLKVNKTIYLDIGSKMDFNKMESNFGFLTPEFGELGGSEKMSVIYDFQAKHNYSAKFNVILIFHEYYYNYKIFVCTSKIISVRDALKIPFIIMDRVTGEYNKSCILIDPIRYPVYSFTGPGFLEIYKNESFRYIPERFSLLSREGFNHTLFNFTYELILKEGNELLADRQIPADFFFPVASLTEGHACSLNGIPTLRLVNRLYKFTCECLQSTYGDRCRWGPTCPQNQARESCSNRGICRAIIGSEDNKACVCDAGFDGEDCRFPDLREDDPKVLFYYNTTGVKLPSKELFELKIKSLLPCSHVLQKAKLEDDILLDERSQTVRLLNKQNLRYSDLNRYAADCHLTTRCPKVSEGTATNSSRLEWNNVYLKSQKLIKSFSAHSSSLFCCTICSAADYEVSFFKDEVPINLIPIRPMTGPTWKEGQVTIESNGNENPDICLKIPNISENDNGKYRCQVVDGKMQESKYYTIKYNKKRETPLLEVEPMSISVVMGSEVRVDCLWEDRNFNVTESIGPIRPKWKVSPVENFGSFSSYPSGLKGSFILVSNVTGELIVTCEIDNYSIIGRESKESLISIIDPKDSICESEITYKIKWPKVQVHKNFTARCPLGYKGHCVRECSSVKGFQSPAAWNVPDCSKCERKKLFSMFANATSYQKGLLMYLPNPQNFFAEVRDEFTFGNESFILPGEIGEVVRRAKHFLDVPKLVPDADVFYSWINIVISSRDAINEKDLSSLQTLLRSYPGFLEFGSCYLKISTHENVAFFQQIPREENEIFNISHSLNRSLKRDVNNGDRPNSFKKMFVQFKEKENSQSRSITIFQRPELILPYRKRIFANDNNENANHLSGDEFGDVHSPLVQINVYGDEQRTEETANNAMKMTFYPCQLLSSVSYRCGRFDPTSRTWNLTKCSFISSNNLCTCSCSEIDGWIGLVAIYNQNASREFTSAPNAAATWGCGISLIFLSLTAVSFLIQCAQSSFRIFSRLLETLALMVVNSVFLYCGLYETTEVAHMTVLMIVSICLVLVIGLSASHQVDIHQKCTVAVDCQSKSLNPPSSIMLLVSTFVAVFLGGMIWIIAKVQKIKLSNAWLPENDDSSLSLTVLCFIYFLLFLQFVLAIYNCYKVNYIFYNPNWNTGSLSSELNKRCILGFLETLYILSSCYQNASVGMYIFPLMSVTLGVTFFIFSIFTCSSYSGSTTSKSSTNKDVNERGENKVLKFVNRFKRFRIPYSGVAETEISNVNNDESMEVEKNTTRGECDSCFDASTINGYEEEESPVNRLNSITTQVDIEFDCRILPCNSRGECVCSLLHSDRERNMLRGVVGNRHSTCAVVPCHTDNVSTLNSELANETLSNRIGSPAHTDRYLNMKGTKNNPDIVTRRSCLAKPNGHCNGTKPNNSYVNMPTLSKENDTMLPSKKCEGSFPTPLNENGKMYALMNGNGSAKSSIPSPESSPLDVQTKPVRYFSRKADIESASKSQTASPHVTRIVGNSRTKSVDDLTSPMSPEEKKKRNSSQFTSLRHLLSRNRSSSKHFESGNCVDSDYDGEQSELIIEENRQECITTADSNRELFSNGQDDGFEHHKRIIFP